MILAHQLASRPDLFGQNLTQSARTKLNPCWFCTIWSVEEGNRVWKCKTGSGPVAFCRNQARWLLHLDQIHLAKTSSGPVAFCQNQAWWFLHPDQIHLAKTRPGHPDQILAGFAQYYLSLLWKNRTELDAGIRPGVYNTRCVCMWVCMRCFSDVDGHIPLTILIGVWQCCCLLMFVCLLLLRHLPCCKTWWIMNLNRNLKTVRPNSGCTLAMIAESELNLNRNLKTVRPNSGCTLAMIAESELNLNQNLKTVRPNSGCTLAMIAVTGHYSQHNKTASELDQACLLGPWNTRLSHSGWQNNKSRGLDE